MGEVGSPDLGMGVTFDIFQWSGTFICLRDSLKILVMVGVMELAVERSMWLEIPSGPEAVCSWRLDRCLRTSSWEHDTLVKQGPLSVLESGVSRSLAGEKQVEKNLLRRFAFWMEEEAVTELSFRLTGMRSFLGASL